MNIRSAPGSRVRFVNRLVPRPDLEQAEKFLCFGEDYTVLRTEVEDWYTDVFLEGFEEPFNSVLFEDVDG